MATDKLTSGSDHSIGGMFCSGLIHPFAAVKARSAAGSRRTHRHISQFPQD